MLRLNKSKVYLNIIFAILLVAPMFAFVANQVITNGKASAITLSEINSPDDTRQDMNVLVIEINPRLETVAGQPKLAEYVYLEDYDGDNARATVNETVADLEWASGGYLNINTTWEYLNEFPRFSEAITMPDGTEAYSFDEANFLAAAGGESGNDAWWNLYDDGWLSKLSTGDFDYDYLIDKYDLINRRNNGEFDQVWVLYTEPSYAFETMMVGRDAYWINGDPYFADCDDFIIAGLNIWRPDSQIHALGHGYENIMTKVYSSIYDPYEENSIDISTQEEYMDLNLWERFTLNDYANEGTLNGVGTVHHPYNADYDYDYENDKKVNTTFREWEGNLSNMAGATTLNDYRVWDNAPYNDSGANLTSGRYYMRFWLSHFPKTTGYTSDGFLNNWWKYLFSLRYAIDLEVEDSEVTAELNDKINLNYEVTYDSDQKVNKTLSKKYDNVLLSDTSVVNVNSDGELVAVGVGDCDITMYIEGMYVDWTVTVNEPAPVDDGGDTPVPDTAAGVKTPNTGGSTKSENGVQVVYYVLPVVAAIVIVGYVVLRNKRHTVDFD